MRKLFKILEASRIFSLPMSIFSWLIIFVYSLNNSGKILYGLAALVGICLVHLAANLADDLIDYKYLIKKVDFDKEEYLKNSQKTKCRYIISGFFKESELLHIIFTYLGLAFIIGFILFLKCGTGVLYYMIAGGFLSLIYPLFSRICLSEVTIALVYGPILFGGVYYVMCGGYSSEVFILSIPSTVMTVVLLYIHTVMDYEFDLNEGKKTLANLFDSQLDSLIVLKVLLISAYVSLVFLCIFDILDWQVFLTCVTIPLAIDLYNSLSVYSCNSEEIPRKKWYHYPMENYDRLEENCELSFMMRMYQSRNLMMYFSLFLTLGIILSLAI